MKHVSLDLETLGTEPGCVITQIGACAFDIVEGGSEALQIFVDPQSCLDLGFTMSWDTIRWWLQQSEEARAAMCSRDTVHITVALQTLSDWIKKVSPDGAQVWGNGATFDVSLLEVAYRRCKIGIPWSYRSVRDLRTLASLPKAQGVIVPPPKVEHLAKDDAISQALLIRECYRAVS